MLKRLLRAANCRPHIVFKLCQWSCPMLLVLNEGMGSQALMVCAPPGRLPKQTKPQISTNRVCSLCSEHHYSSASLYSSFNVERKITACFISQISLKTIFPFLKTVDFFDSDHKIASVCCEVFGFFWLKYQLCYQFRPSVFEMFSS